MKPKEYTVTYKVGGIEKTETIFVDTFYGVNIEHMLKVELNESLEINIGINNIEIIRY